MSGRYFQYCVKEKIYQIALKVKQKGVWTAVLISGQVCSRSRKGAGLGYEMGRIHDWSEISLAVTYVQPFGSMLVLCETGNFTLLNKPCIRQHLDLFSDLQLYI